MQTRQSSVRQSVSQSDWEAGRQAGRPASRQSVSTTVCQSIMHSISTSFTYFICRFIRQSSCSMSPASCIFQAPRQPQLGARVNMFTKPRPCPNSLNHPCQPQQQEQQPPKLTKCQQSRHCGSMELMLFVISAQMSYPIHRHSHSLFLLLPPLPFSILPSLMTPDNMQMSPSFQAKSAKTSTTFCLNIF